jgi:exodeoxyribonuclease VII large subunit
MPDSRNVYSPSELTHEARLHIEAGFPRLWVEGEISNLARPRSGHLYFSLKDERARIDCALFVSQARQLPFRPENGQQVQLRGRLSLYEPQGRFQLIADLMEEAGAGKLQAAFEALKAKLEQEGLFEPAAKQPLPNYPRHIAVVTSPAGAVIRDIVHVLQRRWPLARVRLYPVPVQGVEAPPAIVRALHSANRHGWAEAIILGRGGGSLEDLWAFNDEAVARAVFESKLPVISAVGHETDFSISDFVADLRAPTPSAAAELLTPDQQQLRQVFAVLGKRLARSATSILQRCSQQSDALAHRLSRQHPVFRLDQFHRDLDGYRSRLAIFGRSLIPQRQLTLERASGRLKTTARRLVPDRHRQLAALARTLHAVSPLPTLDRGYAILTQADGTGITSIEDVETGQVIGAQLKDGRLQARVSDCSRGLPGEPED